MEAILAPWALRAEALDPQWRNIIHGGQPHELEPQRRQGFTLYASRASLSENERLFSSKRHFNESEQREFREVLEILALALRVDARKCAGLASAGQRFTSLNNSHPFQPTENLSFLIDVVLIPGASDGEIYKGFFIDWSEATASDAFKESRDALVGLLPGPNQGKRFDISLQLVLQSSPREGEEIELSPLIQLLDSIDRSVFRVTRIRLTIAHSTFDIGELTTLFRRLHGFRDEADVKITVQLSQHTQNPVGLQSWKRIFDLVSRKTFARAAETRNEASQAKKWDVSVFCGGSSRREEDFSFEPRVVKSNARLVAACVSALTHAGDHVTSVELSGALDDPVDAVDKGYRDTRAKWLGYLLREGVVDTLRVKETKLRNRDLRFIEEILAAPTRADCLRLLWNKSWSQSRERVDSHDDEDVDEVAYEDIENPETLLSNAGEVFGMLNEDEEDEESKNDDRQDLDVFVVGYGQCSVPRSHNNSFNGTIAQIPEHKARLKSLAIRNESNRGGGFGLFAPSKSPVVRLVSLVGSGLDELTIDADNLHLTLSFLVDILAVCTSLRRLTIAQLHLVDLGDEEVLPAPCSRRHPLEVLELDLKLDEESSGLEALSNQLVWFGLELKELRIRVNGSRQMPIAAIPAVDAMVVACCRSCSTIELANVELLHFQQLFRQDTATFPHLRTLILSEAVWVDGSFSGLIAALSTPTHPLARSLHTLAIRIRHFGPVREAMLTDMLAKNQRLVNFHIFSSSICGSRMQETNGITVKRVKTPVSVHQKAAFLSVLESTSLPWESFVVATIFQFAVQPEIRQIVVS